jgi:hypothetical protein
VVGIGVAVGTIAVVVTVTVAVISSVGLTVGRGVDDVEMVGVATRINLPAVGVLVGACVGVPKVHPASRMVERKLSMAT